MIFLFRFILYSFFFRFSFFILSFSNSYILYLYSFFILFYSYILRFSIFSFYHFSFSNIPVSQYLYFFFFSYFITYRSFPFFHFILPFFFIPTLFQLFSLSPYILLFVLPNISGFFIFPYSFYFNLPLLSFPFFVFFFDSFFLLSLRNRLQSDFNISTPEYGLCTCLYSISFLRETGKNYNLLF